ncbi:unnamed protein product [Gongylonema pulchrum]|uniref:Dioxygenase n=1 Tax=Gongylonema pulchrum TaxID=637853 RepID=A0A183EDK3_9BILA|nr:unnamed protein product [Gongylonema pulchrum]
MLPLPMTIIDQVTSLLNENFATDPRILDVWNCGLQAGAAARAQWKNI